jgi:hypothetical protein
MQRAPVPAHRSFAAPLLKIRRKKHFCVSGIHNRADRVARGVLPLYFIQKLIIADTGVGGNIRKKLFRCDKFLCYTYYVCRSTLVLIWILMNF